MNAADTLRDEYLKRREKNGHYSLRSFARDVGVSHTYLSLLFSGKRALTASQAAQIGMLLGFPESRLEEWMKSCISENSKKRGTNPRLKEQLKALPAKKAKVNFTDLHIEYSKVLSNWYYLAFLDATFLKDCRNDPAWFAQKFGISTIEARDAIERLKNLEMLEEKNGKLKKTKNFISLPTQSSQAAMRAYYQKVIQKGAESMNQTSDEAFQARLIKGGTIAIKRSKISAARKKLSSILSDFIEEFATEAADDVYQINLQFFSLTQNKPSLKKE